jgi:tRNA-dihydrouridine synthase B
MRIGTHVLKNSLFVAPMAGVTDRPFRQLCKRFGAGLAVSEMVASNELTWKSTKTQLRTNHEGEVSPISVQIAGADPAMMARAAEHNVDAGAQIIDINMGCPVKKVCNTMAGSALLQNEMLVARILEAVVQAVNVPVTLKYRTGWDQANKNAIRIARIAEESGIALLALHGRTRACGFQGHAEYETIAQVKASTRLPVIANGDINTPFDAKHVLDVTRADGVMIGRGAQGNPWIFSNIAHYLATGEQLPAPTLMEMREVIEQHLHALHEFYGQMAGVRIARKHIGWYLKAIPGTEPFKARFNTLETCESQHQAIVAFFDEQANKRTPGAMRLWQEGERLAA